MKFILKPGRFSNKIGLNVFTLAISGFQKNETKNKTKNLYMLTIDRKKTLFIMPDEKLSLNLMHAFKRNSFKMWHAFF